MYDLEHGDGEWLIVTEISRNPILHMPEPQYGDVIARAQDLRTHEPESYGIYLIGVVEAALATLRTFN